MKNNKIILGLDLSLRSSGIIKLKDGEIIEQRLIKSKPNGKSPVDELKRLMKIRDEIDIRNVNIAVIEGLAFMVRKTQALVQLAALNYMVREKLYLNKIPFVVVVPTTLKKFCTSKGNAKKDVILLEIYKRWGIEFYDDNEADAYVLSRIGEALLNDRADMLVFQKETVKLLRKQLID